MATIRLGIIMHGITGRMGYNQHLVRSIVAIRDQGGVMLANGDMGTPKTWNLNRCKNLNRGKSPHVPVT